MISRLGAKLRSPVLGHAFIACMDGMTGNGCLTFGKLYRSICRPVWWSHIEQTGFGAVSDRFQEKYTNFFDAGS